MKVYEPTNAVLENIQRGYVLKQKYQRNSQAALANTELINKAKAEFEQGFSLDVVKDMYRVLTKLEKSVDFRQKASDFGPTEDAIKFYAFGGSAGLAWSRLVLKEENILKSYIKEVTKAETELQGDDSVGRIKVAKAVNEELMQATFIVMVPNEIDAHGDITSETEIRKACYNFNKHSMQANLFHMVQTDTFEFAESYILPADLILGEHLVTKGSWLCTVQCLDDTLWELIKTGEICAVSIGALAQVEDIED